MKHARKSGMVALFVAGALLCSVYGNARADTHDDLGKIINTLASRGGEVICRKGDAMAGIFSVRSFEGRLCTNQAIAAFAEMSCQGVADYDASHCAQVAKKVLNGQQPAAVLLGAVKQQGGQIKELVCKHAAKLRPAVQQVAAKTCS